MLGAVAAEDRLAVGPEPRVAGEAAEEQLLDELEGAEEERRDQARDGPSPTRSGVVVNTLLQPIPSVMPIPERWAAR
ncbi:hypothetical protein WMF18_38615 [Sorangium sp. So ce315]|uniref:hypothetical protein n=1 Tax=Sorangium sp. So ce315 TaxID=3133299 RepID=UPI003F5E3CEB